MSNTHSLERKPADPRKAHHCPCNGTGPCCLAHEYSLSHPSVDPCSFADHADSSTRALHQSLRRAEQRIDDITKAISHLTSLRESLHGGQTRVRPIFRLPNDILLHILQLCLGERARPLTAQGRYSSPWALSRVCQRWRSLMTEYHQLWSILNFDSFWMAGDPHSLAYAKRSSLHLEQSIPTSLCVNISPSVPQSRLVLEKLMKTTDRWTQLHVEAVAFTEDAKPLVNRSYGVLERLTVPANTAAMSAFTYASAPSLLCVTLTSILGQVPIQPEFPYRNLAELTLGSVGDAAKLRPSGVHRILSCCENLVRLRITATIIPDPTTRRSPSSPLPPLQLPKLKSLSFRVLDRSNVFCTLLRSLRLTALRHLSINPATSALLKATYRLLQRSGYPKLTSLSVYVDPYTPTERLTFVSSILSLLSHLEQLRVNTPEDSDSPLISQVLDALTWRASKKSRRCPRLTRFASNGLGQAPYASDHLCLLYQMLVSRIDRQRVSTRAVQQRLRIVHLCGANIDVGDLGLEGGEAEQGLIHRVQEWLSRKEAPFGEGRLC